MCASQYHFIIPGACIPWRTTSQGSILGPLLFILFVNDLPLHTALEVDLYADDLTIHTSGKLIAELNTKLPSDMENVHLWCSSIGMIANESKSESTVVCTYQTTTKI